MTQPSTHPLDEALQLRPLDTEGHYAGSPHPAYGNMVGPFGGATAAQMMQAVLLHPARLGEPVALTVNFAAGVKDAPFRIEARPARTNRSTQHWTVALLQAEDDGSESTVITATAVTAARRSTWGAQELPAPETPRPADVERVTAVRSVRWTGRYEMRPLAGTLPEQWDGAERDSLSRLWVRDDPPRPLDFASLTALSDVFFPRVWLRRARMTPIGTVSMTVYFHVTSAELAAAGQGYLLAQARSQAFFNGFFDQSAELWSEGGQLLATTHQVVYYKE